eukprot:gene40224-biopygen32094
MMADMLGNQIGAGVASIPDFIENHKAGKVRVVAVLGNTRQAALPDVPTFAESGLATPPVMDGWWALVAPAGTPDAIQDRLNREFVKVLENDAIRTRLLDSALVPTPSTRQQVVAYQKDQLQHVAVRDTVRRLCEAEHRGLVVAAEENETLPREVFARWGELGLLGVRYPESDGGSGLDKV